MWPCMCHGASMEIRGQFEGVSSFTIWVIWFSGTIWIFRFGSNPLYILRNLINPKFQYNCVLYTHFYVCRCTHHATLWKPAVDFGCPVLLFSALLFHLLCLLKELGARQAANPNHPIFATHTFRIISTSS